MRIIKLVSKSALTLIAFLAVNANLFADVSSTFAVGINKEEAEKAEINALLEDTFELKAQYWARRVAVQKDISVSGVELLAKDWPGSQDYNKALIKAIKSNIKSGNYGNLNSLEQEKLEAAQEKIEKITDPDNNKEQLANALSYEDCLRVKANYWADMIANDERNEMNLSRLETLAKNWDGYGDQNEELIRTVKNRLSENNREKVREDIGLKGEDAVTACSAKYFEKAVAKKQKPFNID